MKGMMRRKFIDTIDSMRDIEKKCHTHYFHAEPEEATHANICAFNCEVAANVMRWQETLHELDPQVRLQVGVGVYYLTEKVEWLGRERMGFPSKREYEKCCSRRAYEELEPRGFFENEADF